MTAPVKFGGPKHRQQPTLMSVGLGLLIGCCLCASLVASLI